MQPLFDSLKQNGSVWKEARQTAFEEVKQALTQAPVFEADASGNGMGAVLMQQSEPLAFLSKAFGPKAVACSTYEREAMAILEALKRWKHYFSGSELIIWTDQQS